ncbi:DUF2516 family protein [Rugosimonospora acidiphila]|uniref:DUF2516 family protein n=1 Tax=Rugosimonospora acidiphila TaxID=556531 RepID=A0ABP9RHC6_9ACTN
MVIAAAPLFYSTVTADVTYALTVVSLIVELFAFVNCLTQRTDAFLVVGRIPKGGWLAMTGGAVLVTLLFGSVRNFLGLIAVTVSLVYVLDLRPALRDAVDGQGSW